MTHSRCIAGLLVFANHWCMCGGVVFGEPFKTTHQVEIATPVVVTEDRVSMLVNATSNPWHLPDSGVTTTNMRGYLLTARLANAENIDATRRVVGPLWNYPGPKSGMTDEWGVEYSKKNVPRRKNPPRVFLSASGKCQKAILLDEDTKNSNGR